MVIIKVDVVSVEEQIFLGEVKFVVLLGEMGELGILLGYMLFIIWICLGVVCIEVEGGNDEFVFVVGGIFEVQLGVVMVFVDIVICGKDFDVVKVEEVCKCVEEMLQNVKLDFDFVKV